MPITAARRMYSPIAVRPIPTDRAITRSLAPQAYFRRRTSRTFRIDNLSAGIRPPLANRKGGPCPAQTADNAPRITPSTGVVAFVRIRWSLSIGLAGRFPSESVAALPRIPQLRTTARKADAIGHHLLASFCRETPAFVLRAPVPQ